MVENKDDQNVPETNDMEISTVRSSLDGVPGTLGELLDGGKEFLTPEDMPCLCD